MLASVEAPSGRVLRYNPLVESAPRYGISSDKMDKDDVIVIRYLYLAQGFTAEDISFLLDGAIAPEDIHKIFLQQKTRTSLGKDAIPKLSEKLGVPYELFLIHARAWIYDSPTRKTLPFCIPLLSEFGQDTGEWMWFSVNWLREKFRSLEGVNAFMVTDNYMSPFNINVGDCVFVDATPLGNQGIPFMLGGLYLVRGNDDALRLRKAVLATVKGKSVKRFIIPGLPEATVEAAEVIPENNFGRVIYTLSQYA